MASVYDLDELVQLVALCLGDYGNLGRMYQLWTTSIRIPWRLEPRV